VVKVSVPPAFAANWLFPRLPHFRSQHEGLQIEFDASVDCVDFDGGDIDLAIRFGSGKWPGGSTEHLLDVNIYPTRSADFFARRPSPRTARDPMNYPRLGLNHQPELWREWLRKLGIAEPPTAEFISFDSFHLRYEAAVNGLGIAIGSDAIVEPYLDDGTLIRLLDMPCGLSNKFYVVSRPQDRERRPVRAFCAWLAKEAAIWQNRHSIAA
jgi:LysR family transcriptional regulator, glycine cleavage system transcriptional activator